MAASVAGTVAKRDRLIVAVSLGAMIVIAWSYLFWAGPRMGVAQPPMDGMDASRMGAMMMAPHPGLWSVSHILFVIAMWSVMMVGMMTPSAAPMILIYAQVARQSGARGTPFAPTAWFAGGYFLAWFLFSLLATLGQYELDKAALLSPMMALTDKYIAGSVLVAAGAYQWTSLKDACLSGCRAPLAFVQKHGGFKPARLAAMRLGFLHGAYCVGCCWILMALLFVGGVMNTLWIAGLMLIVLLEKLVPFGRIVSRSIGIAAVIAGVWTLAH